jgi:hypothetical protein
MTVSYRPIEGFPGYRVGDDGSVWSCKRPGSRAARTGDWFRRCPTLSEGYGGQRTVRRASEPATLRSGGPHNPRAAGGGRRMR